AWWALTEMAGGVATARGLDAAEPLYLEATAQAEAAGDAVALFYVTYHRSWTCGWFGRPDDALAFVERALSMGTVVEHHDRWVRTGLAQALVLLGDVSAGTTIAEEVVTTGRARSDVQSLVFGLCALGWA